MCSVAAQLHAETGQTLQVEDAIVSECRSINDGADDPLRKRKEKLLNKMLGELGTGIKLALQKGNSIWCFIVCTREEQLQQLYGHYQSGLLKKVLDKIFALLADKSGESLISRLTWNLDDFNEKLQRLKQLKDLGMLFCIKLGVLLSFHAENWC